MGKPCAAALRFLLSASVVLIVLYTLLIWSNHGGLVVFSQTSNSPPVASSRPLRSQNPIRSENISSSSHLCRYSKLSSLVDSHDSPTSSIPKIVHWIYKSTDVPGQYVELVEKCQRLNPDYHFIFWTDQSALAFIMEHYPEEKDILLYQVEHILEFSDALRYFFLFHFGGVYLDMDMECLRPFTPSMAAYDCVLDKENELQTRIFWNVPYFAMNSLMACQKRHPFFRQAIDKLRISLQSQTGIVGRTGPGFLTAHHEEYNRTALGQTRPVLVAPHSTFSPLMDQGAFDFLRNACESPDGNVGLRREACETFRKQEYRDGNLEELTKNAITVHRFLHIGWGQGKDRTQNMCDIAAVHIYDF